MNTVRQKFYNLRVQEIKARLIKELARVCREYCLEVWIEALNVAGALANSKWRKSENFYFPENLREVVEAAPEEAVLALTTIE